MENIATHLWANLKPDPTRIIGMPYLTETGNGYKIGNYGAKEYSQQEVQEMLEKKQLVKLPKPVKLTLEQTLKLSPTGGVYVMQGDRIIDMPVYQYANL